MSLSATDPAVPQATSLLKDEIKLFREFTLKQPVVATVTLDFPGDKRLMFASLCGSTNYFGDSGCSLTGYAADGAGEHLEASCTRPTVCSSTPTPRTPPTAGRTW